MARKFDSQTICDLLDNLIGETSVEEDLAELKENYHIDLMEDGMIRVEHYMDDNIYDIGEWRPLSKRKPKEHGSYMITTDRGAVCQAYWHGEQFSGAAGKHAVAWRERPDPYEFWRDEVEERKDDNGR